MSKRQKRKDLVTLAARERRRLNGQYDFAPRCHGCGKRAGEDYCSHPLTDSVGTDGESWNDVALVLCGACAEATAEMKTVAEFTAYQKKKTAGAQK